MEVNYPLNKINLHIHTIASDGVLSGEDVVKLAEEYELEYIAITDHDSISQIDNAKKYIKNTKIKLIPGVELTADFGDGQCHILGYGIDLKTIADFAYDISRRRIERAKKIIKLLKERNYEIDYNEVLKYSNNSIVSRRDIAKYLVNKQYFKSVDEVLNKIFYKNSPYNIRIVPNSVIDCIKVIKECNGLAILAHPWTLNLDDHNLIHFINHNQFDGLEVFNHDIPNDMFKKLKQLADDNNLLVSCGTDFHGCKGKDNIVVSREVNCSKLLRELNKRGGIINGSN